MKTRPALLRIVATTLTLVVCSRALAQTPDTANNWPQWRGPLASGVAPHADPPVTWSAETLAWQTDIPGLGHSTPIVWDDRIYLTTAIPTDAPVPEAALTAQQEGLQDWQRKQTRFGTNELQFAVMAIDREDGRIAWQTIVRTQPPVARTHSGGSWASASMCTDGQRLYAWFGSYGLYALDLDGRVIWQRDLGVFRTKNHFGEGGSPLLHNGTLYIVGDHEGDSFIAAIDAASGDERWRQPRQEKTSWATPAVAPRGKDEQIIVNATRRIIGYRPDDGTVLWECGGMTANVIPCPVVDSQTAYLMSGFRGNNLLAIPLNAEGDITEKPDVIRWSRSQHTPYVPSPVLDGNSLYYLEHNRGVLTCIDTATGTPHYEAWTIEGLKGVYASPMAAAGRLYIPDLEGQVAVVRTGATPAILAVNRLDDAFTASPAAVGRDLYLRGHQRLYAIRAPQP